MRLIEITELVESSLTYKRLLTVDHHRLLKKIEHYRIRGNSNKWLPSCLNNRK